MADTASPPLRFTGHRALRHRLILSTLTGRSIRISKVRPSRITSSCFEPHEVSFLRLLDSLTNGSEIVFGENGHTLGYRPGLITGSAPGYGAGSGGVIRHEVTGDCTRGISYFLVPICLLAPFSKAQFNILFTGPGVITSATPTGDVSADSVRTAILPLYAQFGIQLNIELRILRRSSPGQGGKGGAGEVQLVFGHQVRLPKTLHLMNAGRIKRVRGVAYATGVAGANNARMIEAARGVLNPLVADTYILSDVTSAPFQPGQDKNNQGPKRKTGIGFGLSLVAESSTGCLYSADVPSPSQGGIPAEEIGEQCAYQLLECISRGGCVSDMAAPTVLTLMALGSEDVGRLQISTQVLATKEIIGLARDLQTFGLSGWGLRDAPDKEGQVIVSIVGKGVGNVGKKIA